MASYGLPGADSSKENLFDGQGILGPKTVHSSAALNGMLKAFDRRAGIDTETWLRQFATGADGKIKSSVNWPNDRSGGFAVDQDGKYIKARQTLAKGTLIDRFGQETDSAYFAPFGTPFAARSLPANLLFQPYNAYEVVKELEVDAGPIAPGFGQVGMGVQYIVPDKVVDGHEVKQTPKMLKDVYLRRLTTQEIEDRYVQLSSDT